MSLEPLSQPIGRRSGEFDFLKIISPDLKLFDNISVSSAQESELSGPFSEYEKIEGFSEKMKLKELEKTDLYSHFSFSDEFISAMESVKSETKKPLIENEEEKHEIFPSHNIEKIEKDFEKKVEQILLQSKFFFQMQRKKSRDAEEEEKSSNLSKVGKKSKPKEEKKVYEMDDYFDTMSGYWRILSSYEEFQISPPDYNAYENEKPHWLETKPIPFEVMENSRKKCLEWLKENFETY